jgi:GrpB-like predicted nucleotidyltransferase (UPF0157 family)/predicted kinase
MGGELRAMIILINGPCGIGKTSVSWELAAFFERAVMLDGDYIGAVSPFEIYDGARVAYLYRTLRHLAAWHIEQGGYHDFVINYVFESPESLAALRHMLSDLDDVIYAFRLVASDEEIAARIRGRGGDEDDTAWHLARYKELVAIQEAAAQHGDMGFVVDTTRLNAREVAAAIWKNIHEQVELVPYDPSWAIAYQQERAQIAAAVGDLAVAVPHIGSTAVPGLEAKPVIDIMVVVRQLEDAAACIAPLQGLGYTFIDYPQNVDRRFFRKGLPRTHHLHIVAVGSQTLADHIDFRDALRADPALRQAYQDLKRALSEQFRNDRATYSEKKGAFVAETLATWRT